MTIANIWTNFYGTFMVYLCPFWSLKSSVIIYCNCMHWKEKLSTLFTRHPFVFYRKPYRYKSWQFLFLFILGELSLTLQSRTTLTLTGSNTEGGRNIHSHRQVERKYSTIWNQNEIQKNLMYCEESNKVNGKSTSVYLMFCSSTAGELI